MSADEETLSIALKELEDNPVFQSILTDMAHQPELTDSDKQKLSEEIQQLYQEFTSNL